LLCSMREQTDMPETRLQSFRWLPAAERWGLNSPQTAILATIVLAVIAVDLRSLYNAWIYDDIPEIVRNHYLGSWSFIWKSFAHDSWWFRAPAHLPQSDYYRPLQNTWLAVNYYLFGVNSIGWHLGQIALQALAVVLAFRVAKILTGDNPAALLTAALFGLTPAHVETIAWVSAFPEPLAATFMFTAFLTYITRRRPGTALPIVSLLFFTGALLSHESATFFPLIIAGYVYVFECESCPTAARLSRRLRTTLIRTLPFLMLSVAYLAVRATILGVTGAFGLPRPQTNLPQSLAFEHQIGQLLLTLPAVLIEYLKVLAFPWLVGPAHPVNWIDQPSLAVYGPAAALVVLALLGTGLIRRSQNGRVYALGIIWFAAPLVPAMNLNKIVSLVQDRYLYAGSFGWSLVMGTAVFELIRAWPILRRAVATSVAIVLVASAALAFHADTYWSSRAEYNRMSAEMHPLDLAEVAKLADLYEGPGGLNAAIRIWRASLSRIPSAEQPLARGLFIGYLMMHGQSGRALAVAEFRREHPGLSITMPPRERPRPPLAATRT
jgi:protein O-mannosyl-transferase